MDTANIIAAAFHQRAQNQPADPAAVNGDIHVSHVSLPPQFFCYH